MPDMSIELLRYADIAEWKPNVGDVIISEGLFFRSWSVVNENFGTTLNCRTAGLFRLICINRFKKTKFKVEDIKSSTAGSYTVIQNGIFYV